MIARWAAARAARQLPPPSDGWEQVCREMERLGGIKPYKYHPSERHDGIVLLAAGDRRFNYEDERQASWREASTAMKRAGDLWKENADSRSAPWERWCAARGATEAGGRLARSDFLGDSDEQAAR